MRGCCDGACILFIGSLAVAGRSESRELVWYEDVNTGCWGDMKDAGCDCHCQCGPTEAVWNAPKPCGEAVGLTVFCHPVPPTWSPVCMGDQEYLIWFKLLSTNVAVRSFTWVCVLLCAGVDGLSIGWACNLCWASCCLVNLLQTLAMTRKENSNLCRNRISLNRLCTITEHSYKIL